MADRYDAEAEAKRFLLDWGITYVAEDDLVAALYRARDAAIGELRPLLLRLEWSQKTTALKNGGTIYTAITCPCCGGEKDPPPSYRRGDAVQAGHRADCELVRALASGEGKGRASVCGCKCHATYSFRRTCCDRADREEREG